MVINAKKEAYGDDQRGQKIALEYPEAIRLQRILAQKRWLHDVCLFMVAVDSILRCSDVLKLKVEDIRYASGQIRSDIVKGQKKNKRSVYGALTPKTRAICARWIEQSGKQQSDYLFTGHYRRNTSPICDGAYRYRVKKWMGFLGLEAEDYSTHSMRRTKPHFLYHVCGIKIEDISVLMGHKDVKTTMIYLGLDVQRARNIAHQNDLFAMNDTRTYQAISASRDPHSLNQEELLGLLSKTMTAEQAQPFLILAEKLSARDMSIWDYPSTQCNQPFN